MWTESQVVNRWIAEAIAETQLEVRREVLFIALERFGETIPQAGTESINSQTDPELLSEWLKIALKVKSIQEFLAKLRSV